MLEADPDWDPSLHVGPSRGNNRCIKRLLPSEEESERQRRKQRRTTWTRRSCMSTRPSRRSKAAGGRGWARPAVRPWRDVSSLLQSVLQQQTSKKTGDEPAAAKTTDLSFRDFFRATLEASLEASGRSMVPSTPRPSSSSCKNCARLRRRIKKLQKKLSHLPGGQEDKEQPDQPDQPDQDLQPPDSEWMAPLSPSQCDLSAGDQASANKSTPTGPAVARKKSSKGNARLPPRFQKSWLKRFPFLRYSKAHNHMWCYVCRLYTESHKETPLIKGSRLFKVHCLNVHQDSRYHKANVLRHMLNEKDCKL